MVGGGPISKRFADRIGADGYAVNAGAAAKMAKELLNGDARVPRAYPLPSEEYGFSRKQDRTEEVKYDGSG